MRIEAWLQSSLGVTCGKQPVNPSTPVNHTEASLPVPFGAAVGQPDADRRFAKLQAMTNTFAAALSF